MGDLIWKIRKFVIKATVTGIVKILQEDFEMSEEEAEFFVYVLLDQSDKDSVHAVDKEELTAWYFMQDPDRYRGQI